MPKLTAMGVLAWLGVPAVATLLAIVWVNWSARPRGPVEIEQSLAERERFNAAFAHPSVPFERNRVVDDEGARPARRAS